MLLTRCLVAVFVLSLLTPASAQPIDVTATLNSALQAKGQVRKVRTITRRDKQCETTCCAGCRVDCERCRDVDIQEQVQYTEPLRATSIQIVRIYELEFGEPVINALPEAVRLQTFRSLNCTGISQTTSATLSVNVTTGDSISVARSMSTGSSLTVNASFGLGSVGSAGASVSVNRNFSLTTTEAQTRSNSYSLTESITKVVASKTELWGELRAIESNLSVPFTVRALFDGAVDGNLDGYSRISQVLSEEERTIATHGLLAATAASDAQTAFYERRLTPEECHKKPADALATEIIVGAALPLGVTDEPTEAPIDPEAGIFVNSLSEALPQLRAAATAFTSRILATEEGAAIQPDVGDPSIFITETAIDRSQLKEGDRIDTPSFAAAGTHQCQSSADIGHTCNVFDIGFDDCNQAAIRLRLNDCCPSTKVCGPDPVTGEVKCRYGGTSIGFWINYCVPF